MDLNLLRFVFCPIKTTREKSGSFCPISRCFHLHRNCVTTADEWKRSPHSKRLKKCCTVYSPTEDRGWERHPPPEARWGKWPTSLPGGRNYCGVADHPSLLESGLCSLPSGRHYPEQLTRPQPECSACHSGLDQKPGL